MDWIAELKDVLRKMRECRQHAAERALKGDGAHSADFYEGQSIAFRNSQHYIENLLKAAGEDPNS